MYSQVISYLTQHGLLSEWQSGFRSHHSCETAMLKVVSDIGDAVDNDKIAILTILDFSKAFDSISHNILLCKLSHQFGFSSSAVAFIKSFLSNRSQCVKVNEEISSRLPLINGVPQGSILGPLLFCLYINDIPSVLQDSSIHIYADDVQLYIAGPIGLIEDRIARLNDDLRRIWKWAQRNKLSLNPSKSKCLAIYRRDINLCDLPSVFLNGIAIPYIKSAKSLGIELNSTLTCCNHVSSSLGKIYSCLRRLRFSAKALSPYLRMKLVKTLVMPHFLFGSLIFSKLDSNCQRKVNVAFNDCIRFIHALPRYSHVSSYQDSILGCSLETYLNRRRLKFLFSLIHLREPRYLLDRIQFLSTSRRKNLLLPSFRTLTGERSYFVQSIRQWNLLPAGLQLANSMKVFSELLVSQ